MRKTKIIETTEKYDESGKLIEKIVREETDEDDAIYYSPNYFDTSQGTEYLKYQPTCHCAK
ncbi:hypothetical protein [Konateibacter massiliensis]|uniref:hypothetical protein n=1 Tax=Konateibacter massiliensis TaxID=2002841 RepID=UPI000C15FDB5|nr:hypothetical protein [Konateibacter massiliensis]